MTIIYNKPEGSAYANHFSQLTISGTRFLSYRDMPDLINNYVSGTTALDYGCGDSKTTSLLKSLGLNVEGGSEH